MIDLFYVASPNVHKVCIALEEAGLLYELHAVDLSKGDHLNPTNLSGAISGKLPVIRDNEPADGGEPMVIFESGAILQYIAEKSGRLLSSDLRRRQNTFQWLYWQMSGLGPIGGQLWHFRMFAPQIAPDFNNSYALDRYTHMWSALWRVMDRQLADTPYLAGDYSIADIACYPWIIYIEPQEGMDAFPNVARWRKDIADRPAVQRAYARAVALDTGYERNAQGATLFPMEGLLQHVIIV